MRPFPQGGESGGSIDHGSILLHRDATARTLWPHHLREALREHPYSESVASAHLGLQIVLVLAILMVSLCIAMLAHQRDKLSYLVRKFNFLSA